MRSEPVSKDLPDLVLPEMRTLGDQMYQSQSLRQALLRGAFAKRGALGADGDLRAAGGRPNAGTGGAESPPGRREAEATRNKGAIVVGIRAEEMKELYILREMREVCVTHATAFCIHVSSPRSPGAPR
jgi:hypothetical protein